MFEQPIDYEIHFQLITGFICIGLVTYIVRVCIAQYKYMMTTLEQLETKCNTLEKQINQNEVQCAIEYNTMNTKHNDGVLTVKNIDLFDKIYYKYELSNSTLTSTDNIAAELILKTELPVVYTGSLNISSNTIQFGTVVPEILKPGAEFVIPSSTVNTNAIIVDRIPKFEGNSNAYD